MRIIDGQAPWAQPCGEMTFVIFILMNSTPYLVACQRVKGLIYSSCVSFEATTVRASRTAWLHKFALALDGEKGRSSSEGAAGEGGGFGAEAVLPEPLTPEDSVEARPAVRRHRDLRDALGFGDIGPDRARQIAALLHDKPLGGLP